MHKDTYAALVGDVIASRQTGDREQLQSRLVTAMDNVNDVLRPVQQLTMTVGDEFQGLFAGIEEAVDASLRLRSWLTPEIGIRVGIGLGELVLESSRPPFGQDGPCWWRAREAIVDVRESERSNSVPRTVSTQVRTGGPDEGLWNSYLAARDHVVSGWDSVDSALARMSIADEPQREMADQTGLNQSTISRRLQTHGVLAVVRKRPGR